MISTYTTKQGDKWDLISLIAYGSKSYVDDLMRANSQYIRTYIFPAGCVLTIPAVSKSSTKSALPPWKRVL